MTGHTAISGMRPLLLSVLAASGALHRHAPGSILPSTAQMATLMPGNSGHPGNVRLTESALGARSPDPAPRL